MENQLLFFIKSKHLPSKTIFVHRENAFSYSPIQSNRTRHNLSNCKESFREPMHTHTHFTKPPSSTRTYRIAQLSQKLTKAETFIGKELWRRTVVGRSPLAFFSFPLHPQEDFALTRMIDCYEFTNACNDFSIGSFYRCVISISRFRCWSIWRTMANKGNKLFDYTRINSYIWFHLNEILHTSYASENLEHVYFEMNIRSGTFAGLWSNSRTGLRRLGGPICGQRWIKSRNNWKPAFASGST